VNKNEAKAHKGGSKQEIDVGKRKIENHMGGEGIMAGDIRSKGLKRRGMQSTGREESSDIIA